MSNMEEEDESIDKEISDDTKNENTKQNVKEEEEKSRERRELVDKIRFLKLMQERSKLGLIELDTMKEDVESLKPSSKLRTPTVPERLKDIEELMGRLRDETRELNKMVREMKEKKIEQLMMGCDGFDQKVGNAWHTPRKSANELQQKGTCTRNRCIIEKRSMEKGGTGGFKVRSSFWSGFSVGAVLGGLVVMGVYGYHRNKGVQRK